MSQHDFNIANQGFPAFRADLNNALGALATNSAGTTEPDTTYAYQYWYDETTDLLKMRNGADDAWITLAAFDQTNDEWEIRSAVIQAVDSAGVSIKTDDGTTRISVSDAGVVSFENYAFPSADGSNGQVLTTDGSGTLSFTTVASDKIEEGNSSVEVVDTGTGRIEFTTDGSEVMRIDDSGNVGIGTTSPNVLGHFYKGASGRAWTPDGADVLAIENNDSIVFDIRTPNSSQGLILFSDADARGRGIVGYAHSSDHMYFSTAGSERMRIDSSGNLLVGKTSATTAGLVQIENTEWSIGSRVTGTGTLGHIAFYRDALVGSITSTASSTAYNTSSDYRLKENVVDMTDAVDRVKALPVRRFNFIGDNSTVDGFLAHEAQEIVPESVTGEKDAMRTEEYVVEPALGEIYVPATEAVLDEDGNVVTEAQDEQIVSSDVEKPETLADGQQWRETTPAVMGEREVPDYQGIDQAKLVPLLTGALKEAIAKIEALEARVSALES